MHAVRELPAVRGERRAHDDGLEFVERTLRRPGRVARRARYRRASRRSACRRAPAVGTPRGRRGRPRRCSGPLFDSLRIEAQPGDGLPAIVMQRGVEHRAHAVTYPLAAHGASYGLLEATRRPERPFDQVDRDVVGDLATRLALALHGAQLLAREHRVAQTLQQALLPENCRSAAALPRAPRTCRTRRKRSSGVIGTMCSISPTGARHSRSAMSRATVCMLAETNVRLTVRLPPGETSLAQAVKVRRHEDP